MTPVPLRLRPGDDLRDALEAAVRAHASEAAFVVSGIGSLSHTMLRFADARDAVEVAGPVEICSLAGSIGPGGSHLHMTVADAGGRVVGGHVGRGCRVRTTAEILVVLLPDWRFARAFDAATGYDELVATRVDRDRG